MTSTLNLTLPDPPRSGAGAPRRLHTWLLWLLLAAALANLAAPFLPVRRPAAPAGALAADELKNLAMKYEPALPRQAAAAWETYLAAAGADRKQQAQVWYRIGKLYQDAGAHDDAVAAYYRSEAMQHVEGLDAEIGRRIQECLEAAGHFAALRHDLAARVAPAGDSAGTNVVAEIGAQRITGQDLDREIELLIEEQLATLGAALPDKERRARKEELLSRMSAGPARAQFLNQYVLQEILYRHARETGLHDDPVTRRRLRREERTLLAQLALQKELEARIAITPGDVRTWYDANAAAFTTPDQCTVAHIQLADADTASNVLAQARAEGADFAKLAAAHSLDQATAARGGLLREPVSRDGGLPGLTFMPGMLDTLFATATNSVCPAVLRSDRGYHVAKVIQHTPARQQTFDEVARDAYQRLRAQKEAEAQDALLSRLREKYDVVIRPQAQPAGAGAAPGTAP